MIKINREKAEAIVIDRLRAEREPALQALDLAFILALESGAETESITKKKQEMRDITGKDFSGLSIEDLGSLTLDEALKI